MFLTTSEALFLLKFKVKSLIDKITGRLLPSGCWKNSSNDIYLGGYPGPKVKLKDQGKYKKLKLF